MGAEIKKVTIQIGSKEIELTVEEAKELRAALGELFQKEVVKEVIHDYHPWRWQGPWWGIPIGGPGCHNTGMGTAYSTGTQGVIDVNFALGQFNIGFDDESGTMSLVKK